MKVLVISLSNLGDAILTYPALAALWKGYPDAEFHVLASPRTLELFNGEPRFQKVWLWRKKAPFWRQASLIAQLALERFHLVVDFRNSLIPLFLIGARRAPILRHSSNSITHRATHHLNVVKSLGISGNEGPAPLPFDAEDERILNLLLGPANKLQPGQRIVVMAPGSRSHLKRWPGRRFSAVADQLIKQFHVRVILLGGTDDIPESRAVRAAMRHPSADLTGQTTIRQTAALLSRAELLITNDSACLHAAEMMGVPAVAIFGPTDEKKYGPRHPRSIVVRRRLVCAPCEKALCPYHHECLQQLDAAEVFSAASKILSVVQ